jgi:hypothetical protein
MDWGGGGTFETQFPSLATVFTPQLIHSYELSHVFTEYARYQQCRVVSANIVNAGRNEANVSLISGLAVLSGTINFT